MVGAVGSMVWRCGEVHKSINLLYGNCRHRRRSAFKRCIKYLSQTLKAKTKSPQDCQALLSRKSFGPVEVLLRELDAWILLLLIESIILLSALLSLMGSLHGGLNSDIINHDLFCIKNDQIPVRFAIDKPLNVVQPSKNEWQSFFLVSQGISWFTDSTTMSTSVKICNPVDDITFSCPLGTICVVFRAVYAIFMCCNNFIENVQKNTQINIFLDSQGAVFVLRKHTITILWNC